MNIQQPTVKIPTRPIIQSLNTYQPSGKGCAPSPCHTVQTYTSAFPAAFSFWLAMAEEGFKESIILAVQAQSCLYYKKNERTTKIIEVMPGRLFSAALIVSQVSISQSHTSLYRMFAWKVEFSLTWEHRIKIVRIYLIYSSYLNIALYKGTGVGCKLGVSWVEKITNLEQN